MIREISEDSFSRILEIEPYIEQYSIYVEAKNIGVRFSPNDLTIDQIKMFSAIREEVEKEEAKDGPTG